MCPIITFEGSLFSWVHVVCRCCGFYCLIGYIGNSFWRCGSGGSCDSTTRKRIVSATNTWNINNNHYHCYEANWLFSDFILRELLYSFSWQPSDHLEYFVVFNQLMGLNRFVIERLSNSNPLLLFRSTVYFPHLSGK